jgi:hypothetical protein
VAEAQARALVDLLASYATRRGQAGREILLAVDESTAPNIQQSATVLTCASYPHCLDAKRLLGYHDHMSTSTVGQRRVVRRRARPALDEA